jgi:tripartite-type tricarboxylate transporter receptor subunit TctC
MSPGLYRSLAYDPIKSFAPVVQLATIGFGLLLHESAGADVATFVKKAKEKPGALSYASPGRGTPHHLLMEQFQQKTGIDVMHVPASNFASAMTDLLAGRVAAMFTTVTIAKSLPTDGSVKLVGVASASRLPSVADVPTLAELGFAGVELRDWYAMFAPASTPQPIVAKLNATANEILEAPDVKAALAAQGMVPVGGTPDQLRDILAADLESWSAVVRAAKIEPI